MHPAAWEIQRLLEECDCRRQRRSGPGGQHRNKVETAVVFTHRPTAITGEASERRSQEQNRKQALHRLRVHLALRVRCAAGGQPVPASETWQKYARAGRVAIAESNPDFPAVLAEAMDAVLAWDADVQAAARWLGCTTTQLTRLLGTESRALAEVNVWRRERGLRPLR
jgi:hypothetical protein